jgi:hypothetical protein
MTVRLTDPEVLLCMHAKLPLAVQLLSQHALRSQTHRSPGQHTSRRSSNAVQQQQQQQQLQDRHLE